MTGGGGDRAGHAPTVVALHGMLGEASDWEFMPWVRGVDLWGWDGDLDSVQIDADAVIGYSMGGRLALHALDQVRAAVIVSAHPGLTEGQGARLENDLCWARKALADDWQDFLAEWHAQPVFARGSFEPDRSGLESRRQAIASAFERWSLGRQGNLLPRLAEVQIPVLWVNGSLDEKFVRLGAQACEVLPNGEHVVVDGCGHRVPWEAPEEFSHLIKQFLSRHSLCK